MRRAALLLLVAGFGCKTDPRAIEKPVVNPSIYGKASFDLEDAKADNDAVVVSFGASHCEPCWFELPLLMELAARYETIAFVLVLSEPPEGIEIAARAVREKFEVPFAVVGDPDGRVGDAYAVSALPTIAVLSPEGREIWRDEGFKGDTIENLDGILASLVQPTR